MRTQRKKITDAQMKGNRGINLIRRVVDDMGFIFQETGSLEAGIDGYIEVRDAETGEVTNNVLQVQSKCGDSYFLSETPDEFSFHCSHPDVEYWTRGNLPVILVVSRSDGNEAYWVPVKEYFSDARRRRARTITIDKHAQRFTLAAKQQLMKLAVPRESGLHLGDTSRHERLCSNLLPLRSYPTEVFVAATEHRGRGPVWRELNARIERPHSEWILKEGQLISFRNLRDYPWPAVCDAGSVESLPSEEWAEADDERRFYFIELLNRCLREKCRRIRVGFSQDRLCYYFTATEDREPRYVRYKRPESTPRVCVFKRYGPGEDAAYYRHSAFESRFLRLDGVWHLGITPTYYYTEDGHAPLRRYEGLLKGAKRMERNSNVLSQVLLWAQQLSAPPDLFGRHYALLQFRSLCEIPVDFGLVDSDWLPGDASSAAGAEDHAAEQTPELFDAY